MFPCGDVKALTRVEEVHLRSEHVNLRSSFHETFGLADEVVGDVIVVDIEQGIAFIPFLRLLD